MKQSVVLVVPVVIPRGVPFTYNLKGQQDQKRCRRKVTSVLQKKKYRRMKQFTYAEARKKNSARVCMCIVCHQAPMDFVSEKNCVVKNSQKKRIVFLHIGDFKYKKK